MGATTEGHASGQGTHVGVVGAGVGAATSAARGVEANGGLRGRRDGAEVGLGEMGHVVAG